MVVHGSVKSSQPVKRNADSERFREFHWHSERIYRARRSETAINLCIFHWQAELVTN